MTTASLGARSTAGARSTLGTRFTASPGALLSLGARSRRAISHPWPSVGPVARACVVAIVHWRSPPAVRPHEHPEQRDHQTDTAHDHQDHAHRLNIEARRGGGHGEAQDSAYGD